MVINRNKDSSINIANPHTIKKFDLIEAYVKEWASILLNYDKCNEIVFIDCMCNSGVYKDNNDQEVFGTPIRVANFLSGFMKNYPQKKAKLYFNDLSYEKILILKKLLPINTSNLSILVESIDGNDLLKRLAKDLDKKQNSNYLLVYDPYTASVDWEALEPFLRHWGEIILNHMVSDSIRGVSQAKTISAIEKYEKTYLSEIAELVNIGSDKDAYEKRIQDIILKLRNNSKNDYFIASFPFFNTKNVVVYNLIHCSGSKKGFRRFKKIAWKTFGGKSSSKDTHGIENQYVLDFDEKPNYRTEKDEYCYYVKDIVEYLHMRFIGMKNVTLDDVWEALDEHSIFPSEGYRKDVKKGLKETYNDCISKNGISFTEMGV